MHWDLSVIGFVSFQHKQQKEISSLKVSESHAQAQDFPLQFLSNYTPLLTLESPICSSVALSSSTAPKQVDRLFAVANLNLVFDSFMHCIHNTLYECTYLILR